MSKLKDVYNNYMNLEDYYEQSDYEDRLLFLANKVGVKIGNIREINKDNLNTIFNFKNYVLKANITLKELDTYDINLFSKRIDNIIKLFENIVFNVIDIDKVYNNGVCIINNLDELVDNVNERVLPADVFNNVWKINFDRDVEPIKDIQENLAPNVYCVFYSDEGVVNIHVNKIDYLADKLVLPSVFVMRKDLQKMRSKKSKHFVESLLSIENYEKEIPWCLVKRVKKEEFAKFRNKIVYQDSIMKIKLSKKENVNQLIVCNL